MRLRQQANEPSHQRYIHPRRFLADKNHLARARCSQDEHVANEEGVLEPNDELWQNGLDVRSVTHQRNMRQARPSPRRLTRCTGSSDARFLDVNSVPPRSPWYRQTEVSSRFSLRTNLFSGTMRLYEFHQCQAAKASSGYVAK